MVVHQDDCRGAGDDRSAKNLTRRSQAGIDCANANQLVALNTAASVENKNHTAFALSVVVRAALNIEPPVNGRFVRRVETPRSIGKRTVAERNDLELLGREWFYRRCWQQLPCPADSSAVEIGRASR